MKIESQKATVQKSSAEIVAFISDIENFKTLMPESINKFEVTSTDSFRFSLQGMPEFELKKTSVSLFTFDKKQRYDS